MSNIAENVNNQDLSEMFSVVGKLSRCQISYNKLGKHMEKAVLEFESADDAKRAIDKYNGAHLEDKKIVVE